MDRGVDGWWIYHWPRWPPTPADRSAVSPSSLQSDCDKADDVTQRRDHADEPDILSSARTPECREPGPSDALAANEYSAAVLTEAGDPSMLPALSTLSPLYRHR